MFRSFWSEAGGGCHHVGAHVLDIASGRGAVLFPVAERVGAGGEVVGIDLAEAMAHATREEAASRGLKLRVNVMDAEELTFPDESFDCVLRLWYHVLP